MFSWERISRNIHLNILFLTLVIITPVIIFIFYLNLTQLKRAEEIEIDRLSNTANLISTSYIQVVEGARQLLITLSVSGQIQEINCSEYLAGLLGKYQRYSNISYANLNGEVLCSGVPLVKDVNVSERLFFKSTISDKDFSVGEYSIGPVTGKPIITFGFPYENEQGQLQGVVYASIDLNWLSNLTKNFEVDDKVQVLVLDWKGRILANYPDQTRMLGQTFPDISDSGIKETSGVDGIERIYAFEKIGTLKDGLIVAVGMTEVEIYKDSNKEFNKSIIISLLIAFLSSIFGFWMGSLILKRIVAELEKIQELRRSFVSLVSHQLRTPLTGIKYLSEILISQSIGKLNSKQTEFTKNIESAANRLIFMVRTLLDISKLELEKPKLDLEKVNLSEVFKQEKDNINQLFKKSKLGFKFLNKKKVVVYADVKLMRQAVSILLTNAAKYSHPGTTVFIDIRREEKICSVRVINTGIPIDSNDLILIFDKFFRGKGAQQKNEEGSGLGLYLCKLIVEAHGGNITVSQKNNGETKFIFSLPMV